MLDFCYNPLIDKIFTKKLTYTKEYPSMSSRSSSHYPHDENHQICVGCCRTRKNKKPAVSVIPETSIKWTLSLIRGHA
jgi:hypothetical protein